MKFTEEDLDSCWEYYKTYLIEILNGEYDLHEARVDLESLIGGAFDPRVAPKEKEEAVEQPATNQGQNA